MSHLNKLHRFIGIFSLINLLFIQNISSEDQWVVGDIRIGGLQRVSAGSVFSVMPVAVGDKVDEFNNLNSGIFLYRSKDFSQSYRDKGGNIPEIKSHLVMDKPESVNLVKPPTIITIETKKNIMASQ